MKEVKSWILATILAILPTILIWLPFYFRIPVFWNIPLPQLGMETIVENYDGPLYIAVAKSLYNPEIIKQFFEFPLPVEYYAAHFPLYPLLIKIFSVPVGYIYSMLLVTLMSSIVAVYFFHKFISQYLSSENAIWATVFFSIFPARWLIVRSVGSPEPLFIASIIASVYFFQNKKYFWSAIWGVVATVTKSPGILLFIAYALSFKLPLLKSLTTTKFSDWIKSIPWKSYPLILMPMALIGVFTLYSFTFKNFFAYFNSGDNIHLFFPPFQIFNYSASWVGTFWLEEIIFVYLLGIVGFIKLIKNKNIEGKNNILPWFVGIFFTTIIFVSHRDIVRYSLPIVPFLFVGYKDIFEQKEFKYILAFLVIPVYLFSLAYISQNTMPISNWTPFL